MGGFAETCSSQPNPNLPSWAPFTHKFLVKRANFSEVDSEADPIHFIHPEQED